MGEKALATGAQRETDLQELKGEFDELEGKLLEARKEMDSVEQAKKALEVAMKDQARKINGMAVENKEKEAAWVEQEREGRKETAAQFVEMQEDITVLVGRVQEMSDVKKKYRR